MVNGEKGDVKIHEPSVSTLMYIYKYTYIIFEIILDIIVLSINTSSTKPFVWI